MADPTEEEISQELVNQFDAYMVQIKRLLVQSAVDVKHALNSAKINGYSLADLIAIIRGEVQKHEDDPNNPHNNTLAQLGGMTTETYGNLAANYFPKDAVPLSRFRPLSYSLSGNQMTIAPGTIVFYGRKVNYPSQVLTLPAVPKIWLKFNITGKQPDRVARVVVDNEDSENEFWCLAAIITGSVGAYTVTLTPCVKFGPARLSYDVHGQSIPVSNGTQAAPGQILPGWFS